MRCHGDLVGRPSRLGFAVARFCRRHLTFNSSPGKDRNTDAGLKAENTMRVSKRWPLHPIVPTGSQNRISLPARGGKLLLLRAH